MSKAALLILTLGVCDKEGTKARRNSNPFLIVQRRFCSALDNFVSSGMIVDDELPKNLNCFLITKICFFFAYSERWLRKRTRRGR